MWTGVDRAEKLKFRAFKFAEKLKFRHQVSPGEYSGSFGTDSAGQDYEKCMFGIVRRDHLFPEGRPVA